MFERTKRRAARGAALSLATVVLAVFSIGMLTLAAYLAMAPFYGGAMAALIVGLFYAALAAIAALSLALVAKSEAAKPDLDHPIADVAAAFLEGLDRGMAARGHRPH